MSNENYLDSSGLQYYHEKLQLELDSMKISDDEITSLMFKTFHDPQFAPSQPENWTISSNGTLNLSSSTAYIYEPEGAGRKNISISGSTTDSMFWLELIDGGNFIIDWDSSIEWESGTEPELNAFHKNVFLFYKKDEKWIGILISDEHITPYWKFTVKAERKTDGEFYDPYNSNVWGNPSTYADYGHGAIIPFRHFPGGATINWGDGTISTVSLTDLSQDGSFDDSTTYGYNEYFPQHEYSNDGIYQIKIEYNDFENTCIYNWLAGDWDYNFDWYISNVISIDSPLPQLKGCWYDTSTSFHLGNVSSDTFEYYTSLTSIPDKMYDNN